MSALRAISAIAFMTAFVSPAFADEGEQQEIIVTGKVEGYRAVETTSGTKTATPILDVPQSISVVTAGQLRDENIRSMADLVRLIPGISAGQGEGHRDQINLRGNNSTADFFVDGLRDDAQYFRSFYNIDRVEAHKGPNAMIFGRGGGGGIVNRVTKSALTDKQLLGTSASVDSFGAWSLAGDANLLIGSGAVRINGFYESLDNHRDAFGGERYGINPVVGVELSDRIKVQLGYEYVNDERVVDRGIPAAFAGTLVNPARPASGLRDRFFGMSGLNNTAFEAHVIRFKSEAKLNDDLTFSTSALYGDYDKIYTNAFAATAIGGTAAAPTVGIEAYRDPTKRKNFIGQANLEWHVATGGIDHIILVGGEVTDQDTQNERINGFFGSPPLLSATGRRATIALSSPLAIPSITFVAGPTGNSNRRVASTLAQSSAYVQDQIGLGDKVDLIVGIRYDRFALGVTNNFTGVRVKRTDGLWSPRAGLVIKPVPQASLYASYSKSYLPQAGDQFLTLDATLATLKPETFDNYEIGAKWGIAPGLSLTTALYQLDRGNTRANGTVPGTVVLTGKQRTKGFELGLTGKITPNWQTAIGYAWTKAEITATTTAAPAGRIVPQVPRHQLSLWNRYDVSDRVGLGLGLYHQAKSFATISNVTVLPAYTRVDAAVFFKLNDRFDAQLNVENLTGTRYFPTAHNDNNITTGAPLNARFTLSAKF
jgi:catecholate siderophore receptor